MNIDQLNDFLKVKRYIVSCETIPQLKTADRIYRRFINKWYKSITVDNINDLLHAKNKACMKVLKSSTEGQFKVRNKAICLNNLVSDELLKFGPKGESLTDEQVECARKNAVSKYLETYHDQQSAV